MSRCGVVYVATKHEVFLDEALVSAHSVKQRYPDLPLTIFTDRPDCSACGMGNFDEVVLIDSVTGLASGWSEGLLNRLRSLRESPYERTLYLDTDTRVVTDALADLFNLECDVAMAETAADDSYSRQHYGRRIFNTGVVLYKKNPKTRAWLDAWVNESDRNFRLAAEMPLPPIPLLAHVADPKVRRKLLCNDQISLAGLLSPEVNRLDLSAAILDYSWNHRGSRLPEKNREPARIVHWPRPPAAEHARSLAAFKAQVAQSRGEVLDTIKTAGAHV